jgi:aryl-alcohol dehydrogenase-like predicted oxidoreductase
MRPRLLGKTNMSVPVMMLGGNVFGWTVNEEDSFRLLDRAFDVGLTFIDTADVYSRWVPGHTGGESETIIGKWLARSGKRNQVILATKVGMDMGDGNVGLSAKHIAKSVDESLLRLQTDRIDLYQSHKDDETSSLEETQEAYFKLINQGKVRYLGASNFTGARLRAAIELGRQHGVPTYECLQPQYNLVERKGYETELAPVVAEYGIGVIPYYGLASGFLSGKYRSAADMQGRARVNAGKYLNDAGFKVLAALDAVAAEVNSTQAAVALAWLAAQPGITAPIVSATTAEQMDDIVAAAELKLDDAAMATLNAASAN